MPLKDPLDDVMIDDNLAECIAWMREFHKEKGYVVGCESLCKNNAPFDKYHFLRDYDMDWNFFLALCGLQVKRPRNLHTPKGNNLIYSIFNRCETNPSEHFDLIKVTSKLQNTAKENGNKYYYHKLHLRSKLTGNISAVNWENFNQTKADWLFSMLLKYPKKGYKWSRKKLKLHLTGGKLRGGVCGAPLHPRFEKFLEEKLAGHCNYLGAEFPIFYHSCYKWGSEEMFEFGASLDRRDSLTDYTYDNTHVCCWGMNLWKSNHTLDFTKKIVKRFNNAFK